MKIKTYHKVKSIDEAYSCLTENKGASVVAGGAWLKLLPKQIDTAIDLSLLGLDRIVETEEAYEIGCMSTLRQIEKFDSFKNYYNGILVKSIGEIMGVPIRNIATIGGTISGKYGFSDLLTPLLVLDTELVFYKKGRITLESFLNSKDFREDILMNLVIKNRKGNAYFYTMKKTSIDFPIINIAISKTNGLFKIAVGARPGVAKLAHEAMDYLNSQRLITDEKMLDAANMVTCELKFSSNSRASKEYREELCKALVKRGLKEVQAYEN